MAANGYFIRELAAAAAFIPALAFAVEDDVGPDSYHVTGTQVESYFDTKYAPVSGGAYVAWNSTSGLATSIATGSRILIGDATTGAAITATDTILIGQAAGEDLVGGTGCMAIGTDAMGENVTGTNDTCLGHQAGKGVTGNSHSNNTFIGYQCGLAITTGYENVSAGASAFSAATTARTSVFIGANCGKAITTGTDNVGIGSACFSIGTCTGAANVAAGTAALQRVSSGAANFGFGQQALQLLTTGGQNVAIGAYALNKLTAGYGNIAIGGEALNKCATAASFSSVGIGLAALKNQTTATGSVGIGARTAEHNVSGSNNTIIGYQAGRGVTTNSHSDNTFVGHQSGYAITTGGSNCCLGSASGDLLNTGADNVFAGMNAGGVFTTGSGNICLGHDVGLTAPTATTSNQLFIDNADVDEDNVIVYAEMDNHIMKLNADVRITEPGVETADAEGQLDVIQTDTAGAQPVLVLDQDDISEEFVKFYGSAAAATITQSLVAAADVTTATVNGYIRVNVQDEGNQITDGAYYLPVYALT